MFPLLCGLGMVTLFSVNKFYKEKGKQEDEELQDVFLDAIFLAVAIDKFKERLNKIMEEPC